MPRHKSKPRRHPSFWNTDKIIDTIQMVGQGYNIIKDLWPDSTNKRGLAGGRMESSGKIGKYITAKKTVMPKKSIVIVTEQPGIVEDYNCAYVGHTTLPAKQALQVACTALARLLCSRLGGPVTSLDNDEIKLDGELRIYYRTYPTASSSYALVVNYAGLTTSCLDIGSAIYTAFATLMTSNPTVVLDVLRFQPEVDGTTTNISALAVNITLSQCKLQLGIVSELKVQNATKHETAAGIDSELTTVVDACPLVGKIYAGKGQGTWEMSNNVLEQHDNSFIADSSHGSMIKAAGTSIGWQEPVNENILKNCKKVGGIKFEPGEIHTSRLIDHFDGNFQSFCTLVAPQIGTIHMITRRIGRYAFVGVEKLLGLKEAVVSTYTPVRILYELNQTWNAFCSEKFQLQTLQYYSKNNNVSTLVA